MPLSSNEKFRPICYKLSQKLRKIGISNRIDDSSATIGKRYSRNDELGTPLGITVDFQTVQDSTITLRDRDSLAVLLVLARLPVLARLTERFSGARLGGGDALRVLC